MPTVDGGDLDGSDAFDPAAQWEGFAINTLDGIGAHTFDPGTGNRPVAVTCGGPLATIAGTAAEADGHAPPTRTAPSSTSPSPPSTPAPATGTIARTALTPATSVGGTAEATVTVDAAVPAGTYAVTVAATNDDGTPQVGDVHAGGDRPGHPADRRGAGARSPTRPTAPRSSPRSPASRWSCRAS